MPNLKHIYTTFEREKRLTPVKPPHISNINFTLKRKKKLKKKEYKPKDLLDLKTWTLLGTKRAISPRELSYSNKCPPNYDLVLDHHELKVINLFLHETIVQNLITHKP